MKDLKVKNWPFLFKASIIETTNAGKVSLVGVFVVCISRHSD